MKRIIDKILLKAPFYASVLLNRKVSFTGNPEIETAATDGKEILVNKSYFDSLNLQHQMSLLAHEALHIMLEHHLRRDNRDPEKWNVACDYAVNLILYMDKFSINENWIFGSWCHGMSAEQIYNSLPKNNSQKPVGIVNDFPDDKRQEKQKIKGEIARQIILGEKAGTLSASLRRILKDRIEPKINWKKELQRYLSESAKSDYSWKRPNRRFRNVYLPSLNNLEIGHVVVMVDVSGSCDENILTAFKAEMTNVGSFVSHVTVISCDDKVQSVKEFNSIGEIEFDTTGGGGTRFSPAFNYMYENIDDASLIIYLTDGHCSDYPEHDPNCNVLWGVYDNERFTPPFGNVLKID